MSKTRDRPQKCLPECRLFRCNQRYLKIKKEEDSKTYFCKFAEDICVGGRCKYAICKENLMTPTRKCGRQATLTRPKPRVTPNTPPPIVSRRDLSTKLSGKASRVMRDVSGKEFF